MLGTMLRLLIAVALMAAAALPAQTSRQTSHHTPRGQAPGAWAAAPSDGVPNEAAIVQRLWAPGLDEGYVPQGLTRAGEWLLMSAYRSTDVRQDRGPCRVFAVSVSDARWLGAFDLPDSCGHAGGLAMIDENTLVVADTRQLYRYDLRRALGPGGGAAGLSGQVRLAGALKGSFVDFDGTHLWIGSWAAAPTPGRAFALSVSVFDAPGEAPLREDAALASMPLPPRSNGLVFTSPNRAWVAVSDSHEGALWQLAVPSGEVLARHAMVTGLEDLALGDDGHLWAVSEAGSQRWRGWATSFPLLFEIDPARLR